jgi:hypothetical protein
MFYKTTAVPLLLHGNESRAVKKERHCNHSEDRNEFLMVG